MLKDFQSEKLYYGFPIFVLGYQDAQFGYNVTTCSSSYSLGNQVVFGLSTYSHGAKEIIAHGKCSLNICGVEYLDIMEAAGYQHGVGKLAAGNIAYEVSDSLQVPYLPQAQIVLFLTIEKVEEHAGAYHFIAKITERKVQEQAITSEGTLEAAALAPVFYVGDGAKRVYRTWSSQVRPTGGYWL